jgi:hypothetical protein
LFTAPQKNNRQPGYFKKHIPTASGGIFFLALPCPGIAPLARRGKAHLTYMKGLISNK